MGEPRDDGERDETNPLRRAVTSRNYETLIDKLISKAQASGQFDNLPGTGQPQQLADDELVPDDLRTGFRMLKNAGFAPPWVEARREIDDERGQIEAWLGAARARWGRLDEAGRRRLREEYRERLTALQRKILSYNLTSPPAAGQIEGLRMADELAKLG